MLSQQGCDKWTELKLWRRGTGAADFLHAYWMGPIYGFITKGEWASRSRAQLDAKATGPRNFNRRYRAHRGVIMDGTAVSESVKSASRRKVDHLSSLRSNRK